MAGLLRGGRVDSGPLTTVAGGFFPRSPPSGARSITPGLLPHAPLASAAADTSDGRVQETGGAAGWPGLHVAGGLSQRSLLGLLDSHPTPSLGPAPLLRRTGELHEDRP